MSFWDYFDGVRDKLGRRKFTLEQTFRYLDTLNRPVIILETGCLRVREGWGDGQSTLLFDRYAQYNEGSKVYAVDHEPENVAIALEYVSPCTTVSIDDSIAYLSKFKQSPDLLYLDSMDVDMEWPAISAAHHLKELTAIIPRLNKDTLVVVDDAWIAVHGFHDEVGFQAAVHKIGGKALFIAEYAEAIGLAPFFMGYQSGWLNFGGVRE